MLIELKLACNAAAVKIKDGSYNFHQENTSQSLAKIVPALKAKLNHIQYGYIAFRLKFKRIFGVIDEVSPSTFKAKDSSFNLLQLNKQFFVQTTDFICF